MAGGFRVAFPCRQIHNSPLNFRRNVHRVAVDASAHKECVCGFGLLPASGQSDQNNCKEHPRSSHTLLDDRHLRYVFSAAPIALARFARARPSIYLACISTSSACVRRSCALTTSVLSDIPCAKRDRVNSTSWRESFTFRPLVSICFSA